MIDVAFAVLTAAVLAGTVLAVLYARGPGARRLPALVPATHGVVGAAGLAALILAVRHGLGPAAGRLGMNGFGAIAIGLFLLALMLGLAIAATSLRGKRPGGALVSAHAMIAVAGFTLLIAIVAMI
jgi:hypothetical protein